MWLECGDMSVCERGDNKTAINNFNIASVASKMWYHAENDSTMFWKISDLEIIVRI